jgi:hypothetical protein
MEFQQGDFVVNQKVPDWGIGKILKTLGDKYRIFFENAGEKLISSKASLNKVELEEIHPVLNYINADTDLAKFRKPKDLERNFLELFPEGFQDPEYLDGERDYKVAASEFANEALSPEKISALLKQKNYETVSNLGKKVVSKTNLIFRNEIISLSAELSENSGNQKIFSEALFYHLYSKDSLKERFLAFRKALKELNAEKWTIATYFLHLIYPDSCPFMKPMVTQKAAEAFGYPLDYTSNIQWDTYSRLIDFANFIKRKISSHHLLKPRDMIDIQGFMWCADPSKYTKKDRLDLKRKRKKRLENK